MPTWQFIFIGASFVLLCMHCNRDEHKAEKLHFPKGVRQSFSFWFEMKRTKARGAKSCWQWKMKFKVVMRFGAWIWSSPFLAQFIQVFEQNERPEQYRCDIVFFFFFSPGSKVTVMVLMSPSKLKFLTLHLDLESVRFISSKWTRWRTLTSTTTTTTKRAKYEWHSTTCLNDWFQLVNEAMKGK